MKTQITIALALISTTIATTALAADWRSLYSQPVQAEIAGLTLEGMRGNSLCKALIRQGLHNVPVAPLPTVSGKNRKYVLPEGTPKYWNSQLKTQYYCPVTFS